MLSLRSLLLAVLFAAPACRAGAETARSWTTGGSDLIGFTWNRDLGAFEGDGAPNSFLGGNQVRIFAETPDLSGIRLFTKVGADWLLRDGSAPALEWLEGNLTWEGRPERGGLYDGILYSRQKKHRLPLASPSLTSWGLSGQDDGVLARAAGSPFGEAMFLQGKQGRVEDVRLSRRIFYYGLRGHVLGAPPRPWRSRASAGVSYLELSRETRSLERERSVILAWDVLLPLPLPSLSRPAVIAQLAASETRAGTDEALWPAGEFFLPGWDWGRAEAGRWSALLPSNARFWAELRGVRVGSDRWGSLNLTAAYRAVREAFENPWSAPQGELRAPIGWEGQLWYTPPRRALVLYLRGSDQVSAIDGLRVRKGEADLSARFRGNVTLRLFGRTKEVSWEGTDTNLGEAFLGLSSDRGRVWQRWQAGYARVAPRERGPRISWETRLRLSSAVVYYQRLIASGNLDGGRTWAFFSLEVRPNARSAFFLTYGPPRIGENPYPVLDRDLLLGGSPVRIWTLTFRVWI